MVIGVAFPDESALWLDVLAAAGVGVDWSRVLMQVLDEDLVDPLRVSEVNREPVRSMN